MKATTQATPKTPKRIHQTHWSEVKKCWAICQASQMAKIPRAASNIRQTILSYHPTLPREVGTLACVCYTVPMRIIRVNGDDIEVDEDRARPTPFHSPSEALQTHCELLDWIDSDDGFDLTRDVVLRHKTNTGVDENGDEVSPRDPGIVEGYRSILWDTVNHNNTMFVSAHMCDQLQALIPTFEAEPIWETDLPDERGTVFFEAAIRSQLSEQVSNAWPEDDKIDYWIKGFAYRRVRGSVAAIERNGVDMRIHISPSPLEEGAVEDPRILQFENNDGLMVWPLFDAGEMFVSAGQWESHGEPPLLPMPFVAIPFGPRVEGVDEMGTDLFQMRQLVVTLFRLIWQHILVEDDHFPRAEQRRIDRIAKKRKRLPDDGEEIKVRHLRRLEHEFEPTPRDDLPGEGHPLTYRIIVRGHPRDQHYPSLGPARVNGEWNAASHRKIWISPHIRGPEDAPLVLKHALDAVVR
jgi:hypothetical protein